jgi:hypothetical protein
MATVRIEIAIICGRATTKYRGCAACRPNRGRRLVPIARDRAHACRPLYNSRRAVEYAVLQS